MSQEFMLMEAILNAIGLLRKKVIGCFSKYYGIWPELIRRLTN
jgi:hypothetical protein